MVSGGKSFSILELFERHRSRAFRACREFLPEGERLGLEALGPACRELVSRDLRLLKLLHERTYVPSWLVKSLEAMSNPCRLTIMALLARAKAPTPLCVIAVALGREPRAVSYHLRVLKEAGLVREERKEGFSFYSLDRERVAQTLEELRTLLLGGR